jgi:hypothetical protein
MKRIELLQRKIDAGSLIRKKAKESDTELVHEEPGVYTLDGEPVIIYGKLEKHFDSMVWATRSLKGSSAVRSTNESKAGTRIFGFRPRITIGSGNFCSVTSAYKTHPQQHGIICEFGKVLDRIYAEMAPETAKRHADLLKNVRPEWVIPGTRFTSGIVNQNNALAYHFDRNNFLDVMSAMVIFRRLCQGGFLSIPEFNARWLLEDHTFFLFDGQRFLHGVTPIKKMNKQSYRCSVVYYALRTMERCGSRDEELIRARREKMNREKARIKNS